MTDAARAVYAITSGADTTAWDDNQPDNRLDIKTLDPALYDYFIGGAELP